jgi:hypothetical protein
MSTCLSAPPRSSVVAVGALSGSRRPSLASAGSSDARTQRGDKGSALAPTEDAAARRPAAARGVRGRAEWAQKKKHRRHRAGR